MEAVATVREWFGLCTSTLSYYVLLFYFAALGGSYAQCNILPNCLHARVHVYSLALMLRIWHWPHYRNGTFGEDLRKNLRNVAVPGTGVPLSLFCFSRLTALLYLVCLYPLVCFLAACVRARAEKSFGRLPAFYREQLLTPTDWFSFWTLNCRLASYHAALTRAADYTLENKWTFLQEAAAHDVPVSPWLDQFEDLVVKDKNEEGGMGIHFFSSASHGGQWVIQERLRNSNEVQSLLPDTAPLSTIRVITGSRHAITAASHAHEGTPAKDARDGEGEREEGDEDDIVVYSSVFRAGREGADTDHSSILFDIDPDTGCLKSGTTNAHWYRLGVSGLFSTPYLSTHDITAHPDTGRRLTGEHLADMTEVHALVRAAHRKLIPNVSMAGWDVALTSKGMLLLEVNLSCNFFRGSFALQEYLEYVHELFCALETLERVQACGSREEPSTRKTQ